MPLDKEQADIIAQVADGSDENAPSIWNTAPEAVHEAFKPLVAFQGEPENAGVEDRMVPISSLRHCQRGGRR